jgi:hypothetical protein
MLKHNEVNPLTVFGLRRMDHCPPHFIKVHFNTYTQEKVFTDWIYENLTGRFYLGGEYYKEDGNTEMRKCVAFELPGEASLFSLVVDTINKPEIW